ncbi:hypothetical protein [Afifella sp. YEN Y35]|uniref:head-tail joining protein n=1 Tax=Afifella sp. YEN Y35 TaxID=3388337 RepID=UPI0039DF7458
MLDFGALVRAADVAFGEAFTLTPMTRRPNGPPTPDETRVEQSFRGIWVEKPEMLDSSESYDPRSTQRFAHASGEVGVSVELSQLPYEPRQGDRVTRVKDGRSYSVTWPKRDGLGWVTLILAKAA